MSLPTPGGHSPCGCAGRYWPTAAHPLPASHAISSTPIGCLAAVPAPRCPARRCQMPHRARRSRLRQPPHACGCAVLSVPGNAGDGEVKVGEGRSPRRTCPLRHLCTVAPVLPTVRSATSRGGMIEQSDQGGNGTLHVPIDGSARRPRRRHAALPRALTSQRAPTSHRATVSRCIVPHRPIPQPCLACVPAAPTDVQVPAPLQRHEVSFPMISKDMASALMKNAAMVRIVRRGGKSLYGSCALYCLANRK